MAEPTTPPIAPTAHLSKMDRRKFEAHLGAIRSFEHELEEDGFSALIVRELVNYLTEVPPQVETCLYNSLQANTLHKMYEYYLSTLHTHSTESIYVATRPLMKVAKAMHLRGLAYEGKLVPLN